MAVEKPHLKEKVANVPHSPGVYQYFDKDGVVIYVGKAIDLKKRVSSYFTRSQQKFHKTSLLVRAIEDIRYIVVDTEYDALLLENNLIKKYQPRYNIQLKDDKSYPWICVKKEPYPRVFATRNVIRDGSLYFGPYASVRMMNTLLELIKKLYPQRTCNLALTQKDIADGKFKVCLDYHIGICLGPCEGHQKYDDYQQAVEDIKNILRGNINQVTVSLKELMKEYAGALKFEEAQTIKEKLELLERYQSRSTVVSPTIKNADVFTMLDDEKETYVNYLRVINGAIVQGHTMEVKKKIDEDPELIFLNAILDIRERFYSNAKEIILPFRPQFALGDNKVTVPQKGDKSKLIELSLRNVKYYRLDKIRSRQENKTDQNTLRIMEQMKQDLRLKEHPVHIECFDNSNFQGSYPVSACVVFRNGKPSKKDYRHYNIKTVEGPNDFASMEEVVYRRYRRLLEENESLPQLIIIDGGKGQLSSSVKALEGLGLSGQVAIIGIAKKLEEIYFPGDQYPLYLDKRSESLKIIQHLRNEAHRFGITFHRNKRSKGTFKSELDDIKGIGPKTVKELLTHFGSVASVRKASKEELTKVINSQKANLIFEYFRKK